MGKGKGGANAGGGGNPNHAQPEVCHLILVIFTILYQVFWRFIQFINANEGKFNGAVNANLFNSMTLKFISVLCVFLNRKKVPRKRFRHSKCIWENALTNSSTSIESKLDRIYKAWKPIPFSLSLQAYLLDSVSKVESDWNTSKMFINAGFACYVALYPWQYYSILLTDWEPNFIVCLQRFARIFFCRRIVMC